MKLSKKELSQKIEQVSKLTGTFKLRSGQTSSFYFDKYQFESQPELLDAITDSMLDMIPKNTEILGGLELGGIPLATTLSLKTRLPCVFIRKKSKDYGTMKQAEGPDIKNKKILLVEDVITTGGAVISATQALREQGALIQNVICVIHRGSDTTLLDNENLKLNSLFTSKDFSK